MFSRTQSKVNLYEGARRQRRPPPGLKGWLVQANLSMDAILGQIHNHLNWRPNSLALSSELTNLERATLLLEDRYFYRHSGIDFRFVPRVIRQLFTGKRVGGVSTIEQQLVRTILERRERTVRRKLNEFALSYILSFRREKEDILRAYLAMAYFGYRLRGCDEAGRMMFEKDAADLSQEESAFVASLLVYPLPKAVQLDALKRKFIPVTNLEAFLDEMTGLRPHWAKRVRRRMNYALSLSGKAK